ncbi:oligopeptidase B [Perkinsela sp. CCAP 1560/4]|nr:oligopeptidase B [Perkinsela sp. CCAP 1560/4]|eukprot:KNH07052.1 oligopeptidase B [Perkinsela sp. CCAP 1560/4]
MLRVVFPFWKLYRQSLCPIQHRRFSYTRLIPMGTTISHNGPIAQPKAHLVKFGKVKGENRGAVESHLIDPPIKRMDELYWLRDDSRSSKPVLNHVEEENAFASRRTASLEALRTKIYTENISALQENRDSFPFEFEKDSKYAYFSREQKGSPYKIYCRILKEKLCAESYAKQRFSIDSTSGQGILLDLNKLAQSSGSKFCMVNSLRPHPTDDSVFAYSVDLHGNESFDIRFSGIHEPTISKTSGDLEWSKDGSRLFYITKDEAERPSEVWVHTIGQGCERDVCIFQEPDKLYEVTMELSLCKGFVVINTASTETTETHLIPMTAFQKKETHETSIASEIRCVRRREFGCRYWAMPHPDGFLYILTNSGGAVNNALVRCPNNFVSSGQTELIRNIEESEVLIPHDSSRYLQNFKVFKDHIVLAGRKDGLSQIWTLAIHAADRTMTRVHMPDTVYCVKISKKNHILDTDTVLLEYSTLNIPRVRMQLNLRSHHLATVWQIKVDGHKQNDYEVKRLSTKSFDGTEVHISMIMPKGAVKDGQNRVLMFGYGAYGDCTEPRFRDNWVPYLKRGMICCIAHIRGGGENGSQWYEQGGKYLTKRNTFMDFIACAEFLIHQGWTHPDRLAIEGRSAGGLLIGAVLNMRPDLFQVAVASVPFVDAMTSMCDASIPLTAGEWEEWGNPNEYRFHDYMLSYSPIDNVRAQNYPHVLILAGLNDHRVQFWEPLKWASKLRSFTTGTNDIIVKVDTAAGHFSTSDRYRHLHELSFQQAYVISKLFKAGDMTKT